MTFARVENLYTHNETFKHTWFNSLIYIIGWIIALSIRKYQLLERP